MITSENINELSAALSKAQGELENVAENQVNPYYNSRYADLAQVLAGVRKVLSKYGLAITQIIETEENSLQLYTMLVHTSGQYIQGVTTLRLPSTDGRNGVQSLASIITYMRRYCITAILGLASEDTDGNMAQVPAPPQEDQHEQKPKLQRPLSPTDLKIALAKKARYKTGKCSPKQRTFVAHLLDMMFGVDTDKRHQFQNFIFGSDTLNDAPDSMVLAILDWLDPEQDSGGNYVINRDAILEAAAVIDHLDNQD